MNPSRSTSKTLHHLLRKSPQQSANGNKPARAIRLRAGEFAGFDSRRAVALVVTVMVTVCAVPPVTCGEPGLNLQVSCDVLEQASEL
jgi:hypothetical protein